MTDEQIKYMRDRFLGWTLPDNLNPDGGITFKRSESAIKYNHPMPVGTNFLDAEQAEAMVRHMVDGLPCPSPMTLLCDAHANVVFYDNRGCIACEAAERIKQLSVAGSEDGRLKWLEEAVFNGDVNIYVSPVRHNVIMTYRDSGTHSCETTGNTVSDAIRAAIAQDAT